MKFIKEFTWIFCFLAIIVLDHATSNAGEFKELFQDIHFQNGFNLTATSTKAKPLLVGVLDFGNTQVIPRWRLAQWGSKYSLKDVKPINLPSGEVVYSNQAKKVALGPKEKDFELTLEVYGSAEYGDMPRQYFEDWAHLLIEQKIGPVKIVDLKSLILNLDAEITKCENKMGPDEFKPNLHTAHITAIFIVKNINKNSPSFNDFFWFGVPLFDARHDIPKAHMAKDAGKADSSQKFIYTVDGKEFWNENINNGRWNNLKKDILPYIISGFEVSVERGYLKGANIEDVAITSCNIGWEVTGTFDCGIKIKNLSAMCEYK